MLLSLACSGAATVMSDILGESLLTLLALVVLLKGRAAHFPYIPSCSYNPANGETLLIKFTMQSVNACVVGKILFGLQQCT